MAVEDDLMTASFNKFLERMRSPECAELVAIIRNFILQLMQENAKPATRNSSSDLMALGNTHDQDERADVVQKFLSQTEQLIRSHPLWLSDREEELNLTAGESLEKYVLTKLYPTVFGTTAHDSLRDRHFHQKLSALQQFVEPQHLDIPPSHIDYSSLQVAEAELESMNKFKSPRDKIICVLNCCRVINSVLSNSLKGEADMSSKKLSSPQTASPPGADEFLPLLILVVIRANPHQLLSNIDYIQRFRHSSRLVSEAAYFFTNLLSAASFLQNLTASSLSMSESEFSAKMKLAYDRLQLPHPSFLTESEKASESQRESFLHSMAQLDSSEFIVLEVNRNYRFAFSEVDDLCVGDIEALLKEYKEIVVRYTALLTKVKRTSSHGDVPSLLTPAASQTAGVPSVEATAAVPHVEAESEASVKNLLDMEDPTSSLFEGLNVAESSKEGASRQSDAQVEVDDLEKLLREDNLMALLGNKPSI